MTPRLAPWRAAAAFALLACCGGTAGAAVVAAVEDNNVLRSAATAVQGTGDETSFGLKESTTNQVNSRIGYVKFSLTGIDPLVDGDSATFTLTTSGSAGAQFTLAAYVLNAGATGFNWGEGTITWNNRPAFNSLTANFYVDPAAATQVGSDVVLPNGAAAGSKVSFSFANLSSYKQSDDTVTLLILPKSQSSGTPSLALASSESGAAAPTLTITPAPTPEPASAGVAVLAALGALGARRRG